MGHKLVLLFLAVMCTELPSGGDAATEGGPSGFGYDASSTCAKPYSRTGRARIEQLPCDFSRENWCTIAGHAYPWQAVRRFVQENQGLMRRMYGDEKHISVLKSDLEENDVELELEDDHNKIFSKDGSNTHKQFKFEEDEYEFDESKTNAASEDFRRDRKSYGRSLNSGVSSTRAESKSAEDDPIARLPYHLNKTLGPAAVGSLSTTVSTSTAASTIPARLSTVPAANSSLGSTPSSAGTRTAPVTPYGPSKTTTTTTTTTPSSSPSATTSGGAASSPTPGPSPARLPALQSLVSVNEIPGRIDRLDLDVDELTELPEHARTTLVPEGGTGEEPARTSSTPGGSDEEATEDTGTSWSQGPAQQQQQQFRPRPEYKPHESLRPDGNGTAVGSMEGQLFQDVAAKDEQEATVFKVRGINACPVKEEVVAPFWANNTRGEVLALLNLYPFEQYVHWEKCTHENKQMYCRDGCRCEQQYRLHRLLAYDPNNECRGIFSDWFKFPSCCICRCYDLPLEFRVTSRSPRNVQRRRLKVRAPRAPPLRRRHN